MCSFSTLRSLSAITTHACAVISTITHRHTRNFTTSPRDPLETGAVMRVEPVWAQSERVSVHQQTRVKCAVDFAWLGCQV